MCVVDESAMTGESMPIEKKKGDELISGTILKNGMVKLIAEKVGKDTTLSRIISLVKEASNSKPKIQRLADKISAIFVPSVVSVAVITFLIWFIIMKVPMDKSLLYAVSVLIIACPCALGLASPLAVVIGVGRAAENGILFNNVEAIEKMNKIDTLCFDKTGTITTGEMQIKNIQTFEGFDSNKMMEYVFSVEKYSNHPIAKSIYNYCFEQNINIYDDIKELKETGGTGISAIVMEKEVIIGNENIIKERNIKIPGDNVPNNGKTLYVSIGGELKGIIEFEDNIKPESGETIKRFKSMGYDIYMISGDSKENTSAIAREIGIDNFSYKTLPEQKERIITDLQEKKKNVAMIGDGINDAPSLAKANVGIAIGTGQDIAIDSADVILVKGELTSIIKAINISSKTVSIIKQNIFWAFFYNIIAIPLAAGILSPVGIIVSPVMASMFMAFSDVVTVIGNSLRLKNVKID